MRLLPPAPADPLSPSFAVSTPDPFLPSFPDRCCCRRDRQYPCQLAFPRRVHPPPAQYRWPASCCSQDYAHSPLPAGPESSCPHHSPRCNERRLHLARERQFVPNIAPAWCHSSPGYRPVPSSSLPRGSGSVHGISVPAPRNPLASFPSRCRSNAAQPTRESAHPLAISSGISRCTLPFRLRSYCPAQGSRSTFRQRIRAVPPPWFLRRPHLRSSTYPQMS